MLPEHTEFGTIGSSTGFRVVSGVGFRVILKGNRCSCQKSSGLSDGIARVSRSVAGPKRDITTRELHVFHPRGCLLGAVHHASVLRIGLRLQLEPWFTGVLFKS